MLLEASRAAYALEMEKEALIGAAVGAAGSVAGGTAKLLGKGIWGTLKPVGKFVKNHPFGTAGAAIMAGAPIAALKPGQTTQRLAGSIV
jgi:hypothetical protein